MTPQLVLVAGPYRSGTDGDPARIAANLRRLEAAALAVYRRGHVPMIGEWVSLPLAAAAGSRQVGDAVGDAFLYPAAHRLLRRCDAVLRIEGASRGADADVSLARRLGKPVYFSLDEVPVVDDAAAD
ncbi:DUF4406 domain-containing protein [Burkholderia pseudomultivorans]|uniref:NUDIX hydrolase n=1 Tax=Burkholderia pseudomultivorans TaxID=1207504 RepID=A0ABU2E2P7_9BURK|nr:DUF4406 domain-containing protein [Burkholderia pseudomultivorans]MDR8726543.1 hypothetical protein [Burkholderia pseudomultivorans]MDR8736376.1 hypothetical protein [Burkholderia pseudomultivorans]MDR8742190.1 hypothetical protein [Burkholderia pseudomultivorans]MDR8753974.1 hypothetical protein [Burkholderia pseudomultivorans]MDR8778916.1 hypothetical protein [Burkholderia pseudomultivorans]